MRASECASARASVRACTRARARACAHMGTCTCMRACIRVGACVRIILARTFFVASVKPFTVRISFCTRPSTRSSAFDLAFTVARWLHASAHALECMCAHLDSRQSGSHPGWAIHRWIRCGLVQSALNMSRFIDVSLLGWNRTQSWGVVSPVHAGFPKIEPLHSGFRFR